MTHSCSKHLVRVQKTVCESSTYEGLKGFLKYYSTELGFHEIATCFLQYKITVTFDVTLNVLRISVLGAQYSWFQESAVWNCCFGDGKHEAPDGKERNIRKHWTLVQGK